MRYTATGVSLLVAGLVATPAFAGPKWEVGDDAWMSLAFLGQVHYSHMDDADPKNDFFLRRGRFILSGQVMDGVKFFVETDNDNAGKVNVDASTDIQDAFVDVRLGHSDHWVEAGLILLPFSFENKSSAASLLGHDYNVDTIKLTNTFVWRDYGAEVHGNFGEMFAYRVGVFDGYDSKSAPKNSDAGLRYTGHVAFNPIGKVETSWFMTQERFEGTYLSIGLGGDFQSNATGTANAGYDSAAWVVDFQSGVEIADNIHLTVNGAWYDWQGVSFRTDPATKKAILNQDGNTAFVEAGLLMGRVMPTAKWELIDEDTDNVDSINNYTFGVHYFLKRHNARAGLEYRVGDSSNQALLGVQFLL